MNAHTGTLRRFAAIKPKGSRFINLESHPSIRDGHTIMRARVYDEADLPRLLVSGHNSRKIGKTVAKGHWRDMPIFTLTLEERATCPRSCAAWVSCYGNNMNWARRIKHSPEFEARLWDELQAKQLAHPQGFVVRLHVLGDFYSADYAELWAEALESYPALHIFGYTARDHTDEIGSVVAGLNGLHPDRCVIRFSGYDGPTFGSVVVQDASETEHLICPAQTGATECCATCALCWHSTRTIAFLEH
jgi:hypothetical protein